MHPHSDLVLALVANKDATVKSIRETARAEMLAEIRAVVDEAVRGEGPLWAPVADPRGDREADSADVLDRLSVFLRTLG